MSPTASAELQLPVLSPLGGGGGTTGIAGWTPRQQQPSGDSGSTTGTTTLRLLLSPLLQGPPLVSPPGSWVGAAWSDGLGPISAVPAAAGEVAEEACPGGPGDSSSSSGGAETSMAPDATRAAAGASGAEVEGALEAAQRQLAHMGQQLRRALQERDAVLDRLVDVESSLTLGRGGLVRQSGGLVQQGWEGENSAAAATGPGRLQQHRRKSGRWERAGGGSGSGGGGCAGGVGSPTRSTASSVGEALAAAASTPAGPAAAAGEWDRREGAAAAAAAALLSPQLQALTGHQRQVAVLLQELDATLRHMAEAPGTMSAASPDASGTPATTDSTPGASAAPGGTGSSGSSPSRGRSSGGGSGRAAPRAPVALAVPPEVLRGQLDELHRQAGALSEHAAAALTLVEAQRGEVAAAAVARRAAERQAATVKAEARVGEARRMHLQAHLSELQVRVGAGRCTGPLGVTDLAGGAGQSSIAWSRHTACLASCRPAHSPAPHARPSPTPTPPPHPFLPAHRSCARRRWGSLTLSGTSATSLLRRGAAG